MIDVIETFNTVDLVMVFVSLVALIVLAVFYIVYLLKTERIRQEFIETLDDHDKSVLTTYFNKKYLFKKK